MVRRYRFIALLPLLALAACSYFPFAPDWGDGDNGNDSGYVFPDDDPEYQAIMALPDSSDEKRDRLAAFIMAYVADRRADDISQCGYVGFGNKPCGGPWTYVVYSAKSVDPTALDELAELYCYLDGLYNARHSLLSDCAVYPAPALHLVNGVCRP